MLTASMSVFSPGVNRTFLFDDRANILGNSQLQIDSLSFNELKRAALSGGSGPLKRPIASISFALNYYISGGNFDARAIKTTNIVIHGINGFLIFMLLSVLFQRLGPLVNTGSRKIASPILLASVVSLFWLVHPIQLTAVLYSVQRMSSLATTFILLSLLCYLFVRVRYLGMRIYERVIIGISSLVYFLLAIFTKEIALLIPVYILMLEFFLFPEGRFLRTIENLIRKNPRTFLIISFVALSLLVFWAIRYALPGYSGRPFTMSERLLTEARVIFYYLSLILVPRPNGFGLHHDDISISTGLLEPWTTLPSLLGILSLPVAAWYLRKNLPLVSFGLLWFLAGHLLESTFFALDIAYEHRNYLPSLGILIGVTGLIAHLLRNHERTVLVLVIPVLLLALSLVTVQRSSKWSIPAEMVYFQVKHHPSSARSHAEWAGILESARQFDEAKKHYLISARLAPGDPSYLIWYQILAAKQGRTPEAAIDKEIIQRLDQSGVRPATAHAIANVSDCILKDCSRTGPSLNRWLDVLIAKETGRRKLSFYYQMKGIYFASSGKPAEAIEAYTQAYNLNNNNITAMLSLAWLFINTHQKLAAEHMESLLLEARKSTGLPREAEMAMVRNRIQQLK